MPTLSKRCLKQTTKCIFSKHSRLIRAGIIAHGLSHQTSHKVLGHYVVCNVTKFQNCRPNNQFFLTKNHRVSILKRTITLLLYSFFYMPLSCMYCSHILSDRKKRKKVSEIRLFPIHVLVYETLQACQQPGPAMIHHGT